MPFIYPLYDQWYDDISFYDLYLYEPCLSSWLVHANHIVLEIKFRYLPTMFLKWI